MSLLSFSDSELRSVPLYPTVLMKLHHESLDFDDDLQEAEGVIWDRTISDFHKRCSVIKLDQLLIAFFNNDV